MTRAARTAALLGAALLAQALWLVPAVAAHPLGNATASRALAVRAGADGIDVTVIVDMAEIPAFSAIQALDRDGDGGADAEEATAWALAACDSWTSGISASIDAVDLALRRTAAPELTFPPGVGGLETLRLVCRLAADAPDGGRRLEVADRTDDGRPGWREVTIVAGDGVRIVESDVPALSPSRDLTDYPEDRLGAPLDVRAGFAILAPSNEAETPPTATGAGPASAPTDDALVSLLSGTGRVGGLGSLLALLISMGLGAAHALTPGHGKALVAASLIGSRGTPRQAIGLGLTVAASHTIGVLVLGAVVLGAGQALAPDRLLAWLSLLAGACVVIVGASLATRALLDRRSTHGSGADGGHAHPHPHPHQHPHPHPHQHPHGGAGIQKRGIIALGLFGGLVPSTSAVIVLLLAATTGQLALGLTLILAFGLGMAIVLASLALGSAVMAGRILEAGALARRPLVARIGRSVPLVSGLAVLVAGAAMTVGAISQAL